MTRFRDVRQRARVCRALLGRVRLENLWSLDGPSAEGLTMRRNGAAGLSRDAEILVMTAWAVWNGTQTLTLANLLEMDNEHLCVVGELLAAVSRGPDEIEAWLAQWAASRECTRTRSTAPAR